MNSHHPSLAAGRWLSFPLAEQLAHVGSEIERAIGWRSKGYPDYTQKALERGLELLDLTLSDPKHSGRLRELTRLREALLDYFLGENQFGSTEESWRRYFQCFAYAARSSTN